MIVPKSAVNFARAGMRKRNYIPGKVVNNKPDLDWGNKPLIEQCADSTSVAYASPIFGYVGLVTSVPIFRIADLEHTTWRCGYCTQANIADSLCCEFCGGPRP